MPLLDSDGIAIAYDTLDDGPPIVLIHGFASTRGRNWRDPRWYDTLTGAGRRVIALDCRGHGESGKPHEPEEYSVERMTGDVIRLLDHLSIERTDVMGYSMGGHLTTSLLLRHPERFGAAVLAGVADGMLGEKLHAEEIALALEAPDPGAVDDVRGRAFRAFADQGNNDLLALAACMRGLQPNFQAADLARIAAPVLVVAGEKDTLIGNPQRLADLIPGAELLVVPGRDHLNTVGDRRFKETVLRFLERA